MNLSLYPFPVLPNPPVPASVWPLGLDTGRALARLWLERFDGFHYGSLTAYLLRAYGYPNLPAYDECKHGHRWGLTAGQGHVLAVECRPLVLEGFSTLVETDSLRAIDRLAHSGSLEVSPIDQVARVMDERFLEELVDAFRRPAYVRDVGMDAVGPIPSDRDVGPGAPLVLRGGERVANAVIPPEVGAPTNGYALLGVSTTVRF